MTAFDDDVLALIVTDPVCGTQLDLDEAASQTMRDGWMHFFCSSECRNKFEAAPERFSRSLQTVRAKKAMARKQRRSM